MNAFVVRGLWALLSTPFLGSCLGDSDATLAVHACAELDNRASIDAIRIALLDSERTTLLQAVYTLADDETPEIIADLKVSEQVAWARTEIIDEGIPMGRFERRLTKPEDLRIVEMPLTQACYGVDCLTGQTCVAGVCVVAPSDHGAPHCGDTL